MYTKFDIYRARARTHTHILTRSLSFKEEYDMDFLIRPISNPSKISLRFLILLGI